MSLCILLPQTKTQEIKSRERQYSGKEKKKESDYTDVGINQKSYMNRFGCLWFSPCQKEKTLELYRTLS